MLRTFLSQRLVHTYLSEDKIQHHSKNVSKYLSNITGRPPHSFSSPAILNTASLSMSSSVTRQSISQSFHPAIQSTNKLIMPPIPNLSQPITQSFIYFLTYIQWVTKSKSSIPSIPSVNQQISQSKHATCPLI